MSALNGTGDRLRRATQLWHAFLAGTGQRFELALFLKDPSIEKQTIDAALASADAKLVALAREWLRDTGQAVPAMVAPHVGAPAAPAGASPDGARPSRYLKGVR